MKVSWSSPSNIALVKYWGKHGDQLPCNPSLSFTLKNAVTNMSIELKDRSSNHYKVEFLFEGKPSQKFSSKIELFLTKILDEMPWIKDFDFYIESSNTFPHSSGIASSASSMSALALCLFSLDCKIHSRILSRDEFLKKASSLARRASGSASRSIFPFMSLWGKVDGFEQSSDEWAIQYEDSSSSFLNFCDAIVIVDANEKSVSSRAGHDLMIDHPFKDVRFIQAKHNVSKLIEAMKTENLQLFMEIVEEEALTLHAMMMTSNPSYILLKPESLFIIDKVREYRNTSGLPICFTIDAGPNIHLIYPKTISSEVNFWIENELMSNKYNFKVLFDEVGAGPISISEEKYFE
jgi:diphosphomevalonate decarboxylase